MLPTTFPTICRGSRRALDAHHLSINISEPASPPTISISHSAVRSDSTLPSFRPHWRRRLTTFAIIAARTSVMTSAIVANKLSKSCHAQVTPIQENGARLCQCLDKSENEGRKTSLQMMPSLSITLDTGTHDTGNGQRRVKKWRAARPKLQMTRAPTAAMGVAIVQSGSARVAVTTKTNAAHTTAARDAVR
jgi:hypothetical protein